MRWVLIIGWGLAFGVVVYGVLTDCPDTAIYVRCNGVTL